VIYLAPALFSQSPKSITGYRVVYDVKYAVGSITFRVPAGYEFDGASIPPFAWPVIGSPFHPEFMRAAVAHDWLYATHLTDRKTADGVFKAILLEDGTGEARAGLMYSAVRMAGKFSWADRPEDLAYLTYLRELIVSDGRDPDYYGIGVQA